MIASTSSFAVTDMADATGAALTSSTEIFTCLTVESDPSDTATSNT